MELKKNPEADLEKKKGFFFQIGLVLVLALLLISFEWKVYDIKVSELGKLVVEQEEEELIPITRQELTPPPPPPPKPTQIEIVKDEEEIKEEVVINTESNEETEVKIVEQAEEVAPDEPQIFTIVEDMPRYPGCESAGNYEQKMACADTEMRKYLSANTKFPRMAVDAGISGTVYVGFVVSENGQIADIKVLKGLGGGCDEEAIRVVKNMPTWIPGKQRNKPVKVQFTLPIKFILK